MYYILSNALNDTKTLFTFLYCISLPLESNVRMQAEHGRACTRSLFCNFTWNALCFENNEATSLSGGSRMEYTETVVSDKRIFR